MESCTYIQEVSNLSGYGVTRLDEQDESQDFGAVADRGKDTIDKLSEFRIGNGIGR